MFWCAAFIICIDLEFKQMCSEDWPLPGFNMSWKLTQNVQPETQPLTEVKQIYLSNLQSQEDV